MWKNKYIWVFFFISAGIISCHDEKHHEDDDHEEEGLHQPLLTEAQEKLFGIEYETVEPKEFHDVLRTTGTIEPSGSDVSTVSSRISGIVTLVPGLTAGGEVKEGERIASISPEGMQGGDASEVARVNLAAAEAEYLRLKPLYEDGLVTASTFREAERTYLESKALVGNRKGATGVAMSPIKGVLMDILVKSGDYVEAGAPIATVVRNRSRVLKADLPVGEAKHFGEIVTANFIPSGSDEIIRLSDYKGEKISVEGLSGENGYIPVFFRFDSTPATLYAGTADVYLICGGKRETISVPAEALLEIQGNKYVYVAGEHGEFEKRLVKTGASDGERLEVTSGIQPGERIVSKGATVVRMAEVSAVAPPDHNHSH